jgi:hypothetical protein
MPRLKTWLFAEMEEKDGLLPKSRSKIPISRGGFRRGVKKLKNTYIPISTHPF